MAGPAVELLRGQGWATLRVSGIDERSCPVSTASKGIPERVSQVLAWQS